MTTARITPEQIDNQVRNLEATAVDRLAALVAEDSQVGHEAGALQRMADWYTEAGLDVERLAVDPDLLRERRGFSPPLTEYTPGRENVLGSHRVDTGSRRGRSLILNGHVDVVPPGPASLWTTPPFEPVVRDGRMYGRGAGDMKAGLIASLTALQALHELGVEPAAPLQLQTVIEEECTGNGALACVTAGHTADAAIIPEPFNRQLMIAQVGVMWARLTVSGRPSHVLDTGAGLNAIDAAHRLCQHLADRVEQWNGQEHRHPLWADHPHPLNFNLGRIEGGDWASTVACQAVADVRVGFFPGADLDAVRQEIHTTLERARAEDPELAGIEVDVTWRGFQAEGCTMDRDDPLMTHLTSIHEQITGAPIVPLATTATTDARFFQLYGNTPVTCYGPEADAIHGLDESVSITSMMEVSAVFARFIAEWCGLQPRRSETGAR